MSRRLAGLLVVLALLAPSAGHAAVYMARLADGSPMYTDTPTSKEFRPLPAFGLPPDADLSRGQYAELIDRSAGEYGVDPALVRAIIRVESNFQPLARSRKGAQGLMQLMPATAGRFAVGNAFDPAENIRGGVRYLRMLLDRFPGQLSLALAAYNAGENAVTRFKGIPPFPETRDYVRRVLGQLGAPGASVARLAVRPTTRRIASQPIYRSVDPDGTPRYSNLPPLQRARSR
jgi:soluble lytic murein transglycosylase